MSLIEDKGHTGHDSTDNTQSDNLVIHMKQH